MTKIYFASHQYHNNVFEYNQFIVICLKRWFTGTRDSILGKTQYFSLKVDKSEHSESSCGEDVDQNLENV